MSNLFKGAALGAGLMYFLDPQRGRRRRALVRDSSVRLTHKLRDAADVTRRDLSNRYQGVKSKAQSLFSSSHQPHSDEQLKARIRSQLGRVSSHPRAIEVEVHDGRVTLRGPVLSDEAQRVFDAVSAIRGVQHVDNQMEIHQEPGNIAALQGGSTRQGARWDVLQQRWSPATKALVGGGALAFLSRAAPRSGVRGAILGAVTTALAGKAIKSVQRRRESGDRAQSFIGESRRAGQRRWGGRQASRQSDSGASRWRGESGAMRVSDIMTRSPATCSPDTSLREIASLMVKHDCGSIPVVEQGSNKPIGIVTDRDITIRAIAEGKNPQQLSARDCMTSPLESIQCSASLDECTDRMEASQIRRMIVVDDDNKICGIVAQADIAMYAPQEETAEMVQQVSTPAPVPTI
jgi:CBS domain-containing protein